MKTEQQHILLVRHPEIERGNPPCCYGQADLPLTARGRAMIAELVQRAQVWRPDLVMASDLQRCLQPARAMVAACGVRLEVEADWREISMGAWENRPWTELEKEYPEIMKNWMKDYVRLAVPGGESYEQLAERVGAAFAKLTARPERRIWVMTHGGVIRSLVCRALGLPLTQGWAMETNYGAGASFRCDGETCKLIFA